VAEEVDVKLPAPVGERQGLDWRVERDPRIVDRTDSGRPAGSSSTRARTASIRLWSVMSTITGLDAVRGKRFAVRGLANSGQHVPSALSEQLRGLAPHSREAARDAPAVGLPRAGLHRRGCLPPDSQQVTSASDIQKSMVAGVDIEPLPGYIFSRSPERQ
jgi:hypothetical protein